MEIKRKRPWWFGWIPAAALLVIIGGIVATTIVLMNSGIAEPLPKPTVGQVTDLNWSSFTKEGLAYIERSRNVRIDLSRGPARADDLGLKPDGTLQIGPSENFDTDNEYYLIVNGGGEGPGGAKFTVGQMSITTADGAISQIRTQSLDAVPFREVYNVLVDDVEKFGWPAPDREAIFAQVEQATRDGVPYDVTFGPGDRLGMVVTAVSSCQPNGFCVLGYVVTPPIG
jgi:hypothetical protein